MKNVKTKTRQLGGGQMKLRKLSVLMFTALVGMSTGNLAFGQTQDIQVAADVNVPLTFANVTDIDFGGVQNDADATLDPEGTSDSNVGTSAQLGSFDIQGTDGAVVVVDYDATATLSDGSNNVTFTPDVRGETLSSALSSGGTVTLGNTTSGEYTLTIGGTLSSNGATAGSYTTASGTGADPLTFTVTYQ